MSATKVMSITFAAPEITPRSNFSNNLHAEFEILREAYRFDLSKKLPQSFLKSDFLEIPSELVKSSLF